MANYRSDKQSDGGGQMQQDHICSQQGKISEIETTLKIELRTIKDDMRELRDDVKTIMKKLNNGLTEEIRQNSEFRRHAERFFESQERYATDENVERRRNSWARLPWWQKLTAVSVGMTVLFRAELWQLINVILDHLSGGHP
jgi:hypothetical protein